MIKRPQVLSYFLMAPLLINLLIGFQVYSAIEKESGDEAGYQMMRQFASVLKLVRKNYVDESKTGYEDLVTDAIQGMLTSLDRFSSFIDPKDYSKMREETEGEFGGIGVVISVKDDVLTVVAPMEDTPGMAAGIMANDRIVKIEGQDTATMSLDQAVGMIKGKPGTPVELTVYRPATEETKVIVVERGIIELKTIKDVHMIDSEVGYVRITQFNEKTASSLQKKLAGLKGQGMKGLVIDLRNNPGGLLSSAVDVSSLFVPRRQLIVFTEGRRKSIRQEFRSGSGKKFLDFPIVTLINEGSASAAEIVAGCLQDYERTLVVGEKSFGKGSVQSIIEIEDGSALRLTTAKYYTPSERVIHENGIKPDFVVDISDELSHKLYIQGSKVKGAASEDELEVTEDEQLNNAVEVLKGLLINNKGKIKDYASVIKVNKEYKADERPSNVQGKGKE